MMLSRIMSCGVAAGLLLAASAASADPIVVGQWYTFGFGGQGSSLGSGQGYVIGTNPDSLPAPNSPWTFSLNSGGTLTVVDGYNSGDQFAISDFGSLLGNTSAPTAGADCGNDITACLANSSLSRGTFALAAGDHSITGTVAASPFGGGAGFFRVVAAAVPEPGTWAMMLVGFGGMGYAMRRRPKPQFANA